MIGILPFPSLKIEKKSSKIQPPHPTQNPTQNQTENPPKNILNFPPLKKQLPQNPPEISQETKLLGIYDKTGKIKK